MGGIRPNRQTNSVYVFLNAPSSKPRPGRSHNIYKDDYDALSGLFRYTGEGQKGDQRLSRGNLWLANSKKDMATIHFFRQYNEGGLHEYLGEVEVDSCSKEIQPDVYGNERSVFVFWLRPLSIPVPQQLDAMQREIEFELKWAKRNKTAEEMEEEIRECSEDIAHRNPQRRRFVRSGEEFVRYKGIVKLLKVAYEVRCQTCHAVNFETDGGFYSEVHHLIPWSISHDDTRENLVVLCANCHRKFHRATDEVRSNLYRELISTMTYINFRKPSYIA